MNRERLSRACLLAMLAVSAWLLPACATRAADEPNRIQDVIYARKFGTALTLDVFKPAKPNGEGVLWMQSGGWFSNHDQINPVGMKVFTDRGQTVFAIVHGSQPKFAIPEILQDIDRATRFVRYHAAEYGVDPNRLGISGGSAGGHLSLMQGARGHDGDPSAKDPVDRVSSKIEAIGCFFPPTDFLNYGKTGENALTGETLKNFRVAFGITSTEPAEIEKLARSESPLYFITKEMPPTLIIHGDADNLVPIQQSELVMKKLDELSVEHRLDVRHGAGHGGPQFANDLPVIAEWLDQHLAKK